MRRRGTPGPSRPRRVYGLGDLQDGPLGPHVPVAAEGGVGLAALLGPLVPWSLYAHVVPDAEGTDTHCQDIGAKNTMERS